MLGAQRVYLKSLSRSVVASRRECVIAGMCKYTNDVNAQVSALVQGRRGQKDPRKFETQERFQTSMARPRSKSHRLICLRQVVSQARELSVIVFLEQTLQCASVGSNTRSAGKALSFPDAKRYMRVVSIRETCVDVACIRASTKDVCRISSPVYRYFGIYGHIWGTNGYQMSNNLCIKDCVCHR